jgi:hypothetical protein
MPLQEQLRREHAQLALAEGWDSFFACNKGNR